MILHAENRTRAMSRGAYRLSASMVCALAVCSARLPAQTMAGVALTRLVILPLADRTTIAAELNRSPARVRELAQLLDHPADTGLRQMADLVSALAAAVILWLRR